VARLHFPGALPQIGQANTARDAAVFPAGELPAGVVTEGGIRRCCSSDLEQQNLS
jgi:hypothetical protein